MPAEEADKRRIKTAVRVFEIVEAIHELRGATLTDLSETLNIPKSTLHAYLSTLEELKYVERAGDEYDLGLRFFDLGFYTRNRIEMLRKAEQVLKELARECREVVWLAVEDQGKVLYVATERNNHPVWAHAEVGTRQYMNCSAAGKAILAFLPDERVEEVVAKHGLPRNTEWTITDPDELQEELSWIEEHGYAINKQETAEGIHAIGAPVLVDGKVFGAVTVSGPANRLNIDTPEEDIVRLVKGASDEIGLNIKHG